MPPFVPLRRKLKSVVVPAEGGLFPNAPVGSPWTLVGEEVAWNYSSIPWGYESDNGSGMKEYGSGYANADLTDKLTVQANIGATSITISRPANTTLAVSASAGAGQVTFASITDWSYRDRFTLGSNPFVYSVDGSTLGGAGTNPTGTTITLGTQTVSGTHPVGTTVTWQPRWQVGRKLLIRPATGNIFDPFEVNPATDLEWATITSVTVNATTVVLGLDRALTKSHAVGKRACLWVGATEDLTSPTSKPHRIVLDATKPTGLGTFAPGNVLQQIIPAWLWGGGSCSSIKPRTSAPFTGPLAARAVASQTGSNYVGCWFKMPAGWTNNGNPYFKPGYWTRGDADDAGPDVYAAHHCPMLSGNDGLLVAGVQPQSPNSGNFFVPFVPENNAKDGNWHLFECRMDANTGGNADGRIRIWWDGTLKYDGAIQVFFATQGRNWDHFELVSIFGGGSNDPLVDQWFMWGPIKTMVTTA